MPHPDEPPILEVEDRKVTFPQGMMRRDYVRAVDGQFQVHPLQTLAGRGVRLRKPPPGG